MDYQPERKLSVDIIDKYVSCYGHASVKAVDYTANQIRRYYFRKTYPLN